MDGTITFAPQLRKIVLAPYIDTFECWMPRWIDAEFLKIVTNNCGSMIINEIRDKANPKLVVCSLLKINQPSKFCVEILQRYKNEFDPKMSIYKFHLAFDVIEIAGMTRDEAIHILSKLGHLKNRRRDDEIHDDRASRYSINVKRRKSRPYKNLLFYADKDSKVTGEENALHLEPRLERSRAVKAAGIFEPKDMLNIDGQTFLDACIVFKENRDILAKWTEKTKRYHDTQCPNDIERRVERVIRRIGLDHVSTFARLHPKHFERLKRVDCVDVEKVMNWVTKDMRINWECGYENGDVAHKSPRKIVRERL